MKQNGVKIRHVVVPVGKELDIGFDNIRFIQLHKDSQDIHVLLTDEELTPKR